MMFLKHIFCSTFPLSKFVLTNLNSNIIKRSLSSALYVTGDKASNTYAVLTPHLDFDHYFDSIISLKLNVMHRGIDLNINELSTLWEFMQDVKDKKNQLEERRVEVANKMNSLKHKSGSQEVDVEIQKLRIEGKLVRDDLKAVMKGLWDVESNAIIRALALPNRLHADTPTNKETIIHEFGSKSECSCENHLQKGQALNIIKYCNQLNYYLLGDAALFELGTLQYFRTELENSGLLQFCNADFARSVVVEGLGYEHRNPNDTIILKSEDDFVNDDYRLHLVGGASLASFCAFHAKHSVPRQSLPLKYYTMGRQYIPYPLSAREMGLYSVWQASAVELFICTTDNFSDMMQQFNSLVQKIISIYEQLGLHFRVVYVSAKDLKRWESLRASIQLFSSHYHSYIEVGHLSLCDDYISKRLLLCYQENGKTADRHFMNVVSGTAVSVPKLLGCILEQNETGSLLIPQQIKQHMPNNIQYR